jgi:hypothetical protein
LPAGAHTPIAEQKRPASQSRLAEQSAPSPTDPGGAQYPAAQMNPAEQSVARVHVDPSPPSGSLRGVDGHPSESKPQTKSKPVAPTLMGSD